MSSISQKISEILKVLPSMTSQIKMAEFIGTTQSNLSKMKKGVLRGNIEILIGILNFIDEKVKTLIELRNDIEAYIESQK